MRLKELRLRNFRNISELSFQPDPQINFLIGQNAQGKTSIIEAIYFLSNLRSFRGGKVDDLIQNESGNSEIGCEINHTDSSSQFKIQLNRKDLFNKRTSLSAFINDKAFKSSLSYISQRFESFLQGFHAIVFNPSDHQLVKGEPSIRRSYLDQVIASEDFEYLKTLKRYKRTLEHRNALLKSPETSIRHAFQEFTQTLIESGAELTLKRLQWLEKVDQRMKPVLQRIAPTQSKIGAFYSSKWLANDDEFSKKNNGLNLIYLPGQEAGAILQKIKNRLGKELSKLEQAEWRVGSTLVGPHRDDWIFAFSDLGQLETQTLKGYGSQGEVRSVLLALKLVEIQMYQEATMLQPLLLLDDFSSELDRDRRAFLLDLLIETGLQVFVTTTEDVVFNSGPQGKRFWIKDGNATDFELNHQLGLLS